MSNTYLIGADDVARAGHAMSQAADKMQHAASAIEWSLTQHQRFLEDWLQRFETIMNKEKPE